MPPRERRSQGGSSVSCSARRVARPSDPIDVVLESEGFGFGSLWTAEAYASDSLSLLCWCPAAWVPPKVKRRIGREEPVRLTQCRG